MMISSLQYIYLRINVDNALKPEDQSIFVINRTCALMTFLCNCRVFVAAHECTVTDPWMFDRWPNSAVD